MTHRQEEALVIIKVLEAPQAAEEVPTVAQADMVVVAEGLVAAPAAAEVPPVEVAAMEVAVISTTHPVAQLQPEFQLLYHA